MGDFRGAIYTDLNAAFPGGYRGKTTPKWQQLTDDIGNSLRPYEQDMVRVALEARAGIYNPEGGIGGEIFLMLDFAPPDAELGNALRDAVTKYPEVRWDAYRLLFEHRLLTSDDIDRMIASGNDITDPNEQVKWAEQLAFYGSDKGLDVLRKILEVPFSSEGIADSLSEGETVSNASQLSYEPVLRAITYLGPRAARLLPFVQARDAEIKKFMVSLVGEEKAYRHYVRYEIAEKYITGRIAPIVTYAVNGSGLLELPNAPNHGAAASTHHEHKTGETNKAANGMASGSSSGHGSHPMGNGHGPLWPWFLSGTLFLFALGVWWKKCH